MIHKKGSHRLLVDGDFFTEIGVRLQTVSISSLSNGVDEVKLYRKQQV
jgi:hypothetical protein